MLCLEICIQLGYGTYFSWCWHSFEGGIFDIRPSEYKLTKKAFTPLQAQGLYLGFYGVLS